MVDGTRSGRVARGKTAKATGTAKGPIPQGVTKTKAKPAQRRDAKAPRGKGKKAAAVVAAVADREVIDSTGLQIKSAAYAATWTEQKQLSPTKPKVARVYNEIWASTFASIAFISEESISTTDDTNTITLNLIDHIIKPENWNPQLSYNVLSATCFFFASKITGLTRNTPDKIANAMKVDLHLIEAMAGPHVHYNPALRARLEEALRVGPEDVVKGYGILFEQRGGLKEFVGEYAGELEALPGPSELGKMEVQTVMSGMAWKEGEGLGAEKRGEASPVKAASESHTSGGLCWNSKGAKEQQAEGNVSEEALPSDEAAIEAEKASEVELDPAELDDFDRYVEENE